MPTIITPNDGSLAAFTLPRDPDRGERVGLSLNDRQLVSAGGVLKTLSKGPASQSFPLSYSSLNRREFEQLDAYIKDTLIGGVKTFRIQYGNHENLLTRTIHLGEDPPWQKLGTTQDPTVSYPADVLAPDFSNSAVQVDYDDWSGLGANQRIQAYAQTPEAQSVSVTNGDIVQLGVWARTTTALSPLSSFHRFKVVTDSESSGALLITLTDVWQFFTDGYTFVSGGGDNLAWQIGSLASSTADYRVYYWQPQLVLNGSSVIKANPYQVIPESDFGHLDVKFGDPALKWIERADDSIDVTLNIFKMGTG